MTPDNKKINMFLHNYTEFIHVTPIVQEMLLGFDILHKKAVLNMRNKTLNVDGSMLPLIVENDCRQKEKLQWYR